jgi:hypothetical protein
VRGDTGHCSSAPPPSQGLWAPGVGIWAVDDSPSADKPVAGRVLRQLEPQRVQAQVDADVATADKLLASDFTQVTPSGSLLTKDDALDLLRTGNVDFTKIDVLGDITVHDYGEAAVLTYRATMSVTDQGAGRPHPRRLAHRRLRGARRPLAGPLRPNHGRRLPPARRVRSAGPRPRGFTDARQRSLPPAPKH